MPVCGFFHNVNISEGNTVLRSTNAKHQASNTVIVGISL